MLCGPLALTCFQKIGSTELQISVKKEVAQALRAVFVKPTVPGMQSVGKARFTQSGEAEKKRQADDQLLVRKAGQSRHSLQDVPGA